MTGLRWRVVRVVCYRLVMHQNVICDFWVGLFSAKDVFCKPAISIFDSQLLTNWLFDYLEQLVLISMRARSLFLCGSWASCVMFMVLLCPNAACVGLLKRLVMVNSLTIGVSTVYFVCCWLLLLLLTEAGCWHDGPTGCAETSATPSSVPP